jgi:hypothetical protein
VLARHQLFKSGIRSKTSFIAEREEVLRDIRLTWRDP